MITQNHLRKNKNRKLNIQSPETGRVIFGLLRITFPSQVAAPELGTTKMGQLEIVAGSYIGDSIRIIIHGAFCPAPFKVVKFQPLKSVCGD